MTDNKKNVIVQEYVTCASCEQVSPRGTSQCPNCNKFLKGGTSLQKDGVSARKENKDSAKRLLQDYDLDWDDVSETLRIMAKRAVNGSTADMRAFLQQIEELTPAKRAIGTEEAGVKVPDLVLTGDTVEAINKSMIQLRLILKDLPE